MHILIIPSWYPTKNNPIAGIFFKEQAEALATKIDKVGVLIIREISILNLREIIKEKIFLYKIGIGNYSKTKELELGYISIPKIKFIKKLQNIIFSNLAFKKYIKQYGKPDLCHLHSYLRGDTALMIKQRYGIPFVITEHFSGFARKLIDDKSIEFAKKVFKNAEKRIAVSKKFANLLYNVTGQNFIYIPNMTDPFYFTIINNKGKSRDFAFLNIASLDENKNHNMLLEAFAEKFKDKKNVILIIVGRGPLEIKLKAKARNLNIEKNVVFFGPASREQVKQLFQSSDAFVLSSKYETFGVVLIEALSCGLPVIATKCGGPESIVVEENIGELVDIDKDALANAMEKVYSKKYNSEYIRKYAIEHFSKEAVTSELIKVYKTVLLAKKNSNTDRNIA